MKELLNSLKSNIDVQILNQVDKALIEQYKFVSISAKDNYFLVAISPSSNKDMVNKRLRQVYEYLIKFIQVPDSTINDLISSLNF